LQGFPIQGAELGITEASPEPARLALPDPGYLGEGHGCAETGPAAVVRCKAVAYAFGRA